MSNYEDRAMNQTHDGLDFLKGQSAHDQEAVRIVERVLGPVGYGSLDLSHPTEAVAAYHHRQRAMELICHEADLANLAYLAGTAAVGAIDKDARTVLESNISERWGVMQPRVTGVV